MKKIFVMMIFIVGIFYALPVCADELSELKKQMNAMQSQMDLMQRQYQEQLQAMQKKIESFEQARQTEDATVLTSGQGILERLMDQNIPTLKGEWLEIGGELEFEYLDAQSDDNADVDTTTATGGSESDGRFQVDKFVLTTKVNFSKDIYWSQNLEFAPGTGSSDANTVDIDNSYLMVKHVLDHFGFDDPSDMYFSIGLKDPFEKPGRYTENYTLPSTAFNRNEELGIQLGGALNPVYWRFSMSNGNSLSDRGPNDDSSDFEIIVDGELNSDDDTNKEVSFGLGIDTSLGENGNIDVLAFHNTSRLSNEDIAFLRGIAGYAGSFADDDNMEQGVRINYRNGGLHLLGMVNKAKDGTLDREGLIAEIAYQFKLDGVERDGRKYITAIQPVFNYSQLSLDNDNIQRVVTDARTWDRQKYILGLITDLTKNMKLKIEYAINDENTGGDDVNNNEFLTQLEVKF